MPPRSPRQSRAGRRRAALAARRARRVTGLVVLAVVALITLLLTAFGSSRPAAVLSPLPAPAGRLVPAGPPQPQVVALAGSLRIQLPVPQSRVTAIAYHAAGGGVLGLDPLGRQANQGFFSRTFHKIFGGGGGGLRYYEISGGQGSGTGELDVGAPPGTDAYSPVDGTIVGVIPYLLNRTQFGARIDIQPAGAPSIVVSLTHLRPDPGLTVGSAVAAGSSKIGTVLDFSKVERQALARYTQDAGNHLALQVRAASALATP